MINQYVLHISSLKAEPVLADRLQPGIAYNEILSFVVAYLDAWSPCSQNFFCAAKSYLTAEA